MHMMEQLLIPFRSLPILLVSYAQLKASLDGQPSFTRSHPSSFLSSSSTSSTTGLTLAGGIWVTWSLANTFFSVKLPKLWDGPVFAKGRKTLRHHHFQALSKFDPKTFQEKWGQNFEFSRLNSFLQFFMPFGQR